MTGPLPQLRICLLGLGPYTHPPVLLHPCSLASRPLLGSEGVGLPKGRHNPHSSFVWIRKRVPSECTQLREPPISPSPLAQAASRSEQRAQLCAAAPLVLPRPSAAGPLRPQLSALPETPPLLWALGSACFQTGQKRGVESSSKEDKVSSLLHL